MGAEALEATEADVAADVPAGSRRQNEWLRRTKQNKIRKTVREVYLRDDISPELFEGADQILVLDTNVALHQIDFIAEDECVNHVVVPYTVLQEVRNRNMGTYARLRALCRVDVPEMKAEDDNPDVVPVKQRKGRMQRDMSGSRNARRFYVFPNEYFRETYVERRPEESWNDRNDRAIRRVAHWYRRHLVGPEVILLTDDRACREKAVADGLVAHTAGSFVQLMKKLFPEAGEKLAIREQDDDATPAASSSAPAAGKKRKAGAAAAQSKDPRAVYPAHLKASEVEARLKERSLVQGVIRMHMNTCMHATVAAGALEIDIGGRLSLNRAIDGDVVAVELDDEDDSDGDGERAEKRLRREMPSAEFGADGSKAPSLTEDLREGARPATDKGQRRKGRVVGIIKRNWREYCGTLRPLHAERKDEMGAGFSKADRVFIPADARVPNVAVSTRHSSNLDNKRIVVVIDGWDRYSHQPRGHWTQILGEVGDRSVESAVILHEHGVITREFSEAVLRCLPPANFTPGPDDLKGRTDLRGICVCSVDPPGCKDIDDAVSCEPLPNGNFRVGVHIADVTHFVLPGTAIDQEASERCTTVYLVEKRTDMLPSLLTTDLCSLVGGVERLCFTVLWELTPDADIVKIDYCKAIIKSRAALSYAEAQARMDDPNDTSEITLSLRNLNRLCKLIRAKRVARGALELASQEVKFELDSETQDPTDVAEYEQRETNKLIEELMLLANQAVATKILESFPMFGVLRRHPPPKDEALKTLRKLLGKHGLDFKFDSNKELGRSLDAAVKPDDPFFNTLVRTMATRCMNQAVYFCTGEVQPALYSHYGLAMDLYTHFTSPIRRYADVLVHRLLMAALGIAPLPEQLQSKPVISEQCDKINVKHRMAQWAGRASADLHTFLFFNAKGKKEAEAVVTRVRRTGMQVVVPRFGIDGVVPMAEEEWDVDEEEQFVVNKADKSIKVGVFDHVMVSIEADNADFRNKTYLTYVRKVQQDEREDYARVEAARKVAQREMFPDRLVREAN
eukprot:TRINITY_DN64157_c0_g1_i1.p1 TRINITY_DN64157_c0_g1~~TRINITY_DN64157_c0_g1_i1.p1  ORF type:complete len:1022 (+),score=282.12 TRINITY_DN64157_c0_g1_i1:167-3232(+)